MNLKVSYHDYVKYEEHFSTAHNLVLVTEEEDVLKSFISRSATAGILWEKKLTSSIFLTSFMHDKYKERTSSFTSQVHTACLFLTKFLS